ncbi:MAG: flagellar basal body L-ring protein FlgH [Alphaproteobacteria bacterium]|nr:flagellar basal body L-ring protein FlgH [Alphaproteobacteria bacterium]
MTMLNVKTKTGRAAGFLLAAFLLTGCSALDRIADIGATPKLEAIENPTQQKGYMPVSMPMPAPQLGDRQPNSLWQPGSRAFFRDQRASRVGDILTVLVQMDEKAEIDNETTRERDNSESADATNILGYENQLGELLFSGADPTSIIDSGSKSKSSGKGSVDRAEKISLRVAATIIQVLPNGNFVIQGKQQMTVNFDMRELLINGVIRPEDISSENTVNYDQIAEARIAYGGRGQIMDVQQARYGQQLYDILFPF